MSMSRKVDKRQKSFSFTDSKKSSERESGETVVKESSVVCLKERRKAATQEILINQLRYSGHLSLKRG